MNEVKYNLAQNNLEICTNVIVDSGLLAHLLGADAERIRTNDQVTGKVIDAASRRGLTKLRDAATDRFRAGVVLYTGRQTVPLGDRLWAVPISGLWQGT